MSENKMAAFFWIWIIGWLLYGILGASFGFYQIDANWKDDNGSYTQGSYM